VRPKPERAGPIPVSTLLTNVKRAWRYRAPLAAAMSFFQPLRSLTVGVRKMMSP
jgi:hypothetical protein